jgi:hypothetical protein
MDSNGYLLGFFTKCAHHGLGCAEALQLLQKVAEGNSAGTDGAAPFAAANSTAGVKNPPEIAPPSIGAAGKEVATTSTTTPVFGSSPSVIRPDVPDLTGRAVQVPVPPGDTGGPGGGSGAAVAQSTSGTLTSPGVARP